MQALVEQLLATSPWEAGAALLGLAYLLLAVRRSLLCWLCAFISTAIYLVLFARAALYMQSVLQVFYLIMAVYGFAQWRQGRDAAGEVLIRSWRARRHVVAAVSVMGISLVNGWLLSRTDAAAPYLDAFVTWGSIVTTWMVARRVIENWLYWIVIDSTAAWLYFSQGLLATTALFVIYLGIVVHGYLVWRREQRVQKDSRPITDSARFHAPAADRPPDQRGPHHFAQHHCDEGHGDQGHSQRVPAELAAMDNGERPWVP